MPWVLLTLLVTLIFFQVEYSALNRIEHQQGEGLTQL